MAKQHFSLYWPAYLAAVFFLVLSHYYFGQIGDDSYIYFRYVDRALAGHFGTWSDQVFPAEGYSSPLWFLMLTGLSATGVSVIAVAQWLGVLFAALTFFLTYKLSRLVGGTTFQASLVCLGLSLIAGGYYWSTSGLETPFYMALIVGVAIALITERGVPLAIAILSLSRPEGPLLALAVLLSYQAVAQKRLSAKACVLACFPFLCWLVFRLDFYGLPLANTYYAKATGDLQVRIVEGLLYSIPVLLLWIVCWINQWFHRDKGLLVVLGLASWLLGIVVGGGGGWMFYFRLLMPVIPLLLVLLIVFWPRSSLIMKGAALVAMIPFAFFQVVPVSDAIQAFQGRKLPVAHYQEGEMVPQSIALAEAMEARYVVKDKLIAVNHAGIIPFALKEADFIDMVGLNNKTIAMADGGLHKKYDVNYVFEKKPDLIVLNARVKPGTDGEIYHTGYWEGESALFKDPRFAENYQYTGLNIKWGWRIPSPFHWFYKGHQDSWVLVYEKNGLAKRVKE